MKTLYDYGYQVEVNSEGTYVFFHDKACMPTFYISKDGKLTCYDIISPAGLALIAENTLKELFPEKPVLVDANALMGCLDFLSNVNGYIHIETLKGFLAEFPTERR